MRTSIRCRCGCLVSARVGSGGRCPSCGRLLGRSQEAQSNPPPLPKTKEPAPAPPVPSLSGGWWPPSPLAAAIGGGGAALVAFVLAFLLAFEGTPSTKLSTEEIVDRSEASIAAVVGETSWGTGFLARPGVLVTNAHVIEGQPIGSLQVFFPSAPANFRGPHSARLLEEDIPRDLAVLWVETDLPPLPLAEGYRFRKGEEVTIIGSPGVGGGRGVLLNAVTKGVLSTVWMDDDIPFYQIGAAINQGNSGGPVFDSRGQVIGVATATFNEVQALGLCVPVADVVSILHRAAAVDERTQAAIQNVHDLAAERSRP